MTTIKIEIPAISELAAAIHVLASASYETALILKSGKSEPKAAAETAAAKEEKSEPKGKKAAAEKKPAPITLEQVRAKLVTLTQAGKQVEVKALIKEYGGTKLSDIPVDKYPELMQEAEGL